MTRQADLRRLQDLATLVRDRDLAQLKRIAEARAEVEARLETLRHPAEAPDLSLVAAAQARLAWEGWAERQRRDLNTRLARLHAEQAEAEDRARLSFGRADLLDRLGQKLGRIRRPA